MKEFLNLLDDNHIRYYDVVSERESVIPIVGLILGTDNTISVVNQLKKIGGCHSDMIQM